MGTVLRYAASMGTTEAAARGKRRKRQLKMGLLAAAAGTGILLTMAMAPNTLQLLRFIPGQKGSRFTYQNKRALGRLKEKGMVTFTRVGSKWYARITDKGRSHLDTEELREHMRRPRKRWDRRWRVIAFDIPERRRSIRDRLRARMVSYGFIKLQDSVWVYPHDCKEVLALIKAELKVGAAVLYMVVEEIEHDRRLREHFKLPLSD